MALAPLLLIMVFSINYGPDTDCSVIDLQRVVDELYEQGHLSPHYNKAGFESYLVKHPRGTLYYGSYGSDYTFYSRCPTDNGKAIQCTLDDLQVKIALLHLVK